MKIHHNIIEQVPPSYYQSGIKNNYLQRLWHTNKLNEVFKNMNGNPNRILDVGCASGWFIFEVSKKFPNSSCFGVDIYDKAIGYAKKEYPRIQFKTADAHELPYKVNTFDYVFCTEVLEHVENPSVVVLEIKRVLKRDGIAIIELDSGSILFSIIWFLWRKFKGKVWNDAHTHSFDMKKLEKIINEAGFQILNKKKFNVGMAIIFASSKK